MSWYYEGPESKPVGPLSLDELHARRLNGSLSPESYVIEHTGGPGESPAWKRYRDVFPASPSLPPVPQAAPLPPPPPVNPLPGRPASQTHPLFPSAAPIPGVSHSFAPDTRSDPYYKPARPTNTCCAWGFGLGVAAFALSFFCVGFIPALIAPFFCVVGLMQVHKNPGQAGQRRAITGLILSGMALLISVIIIAIVSTSLIKAHSQTTTEQTSNSSE